MLAAAFVMGVLAVAGPASAAGGSAAPVTPGERAEARRRAEHDRVVAYWTNDRVARATPREVVFDPARGGFTAAKGKPGGGGTTESTVTGASWTGRGQVLQTTGKVLFTMGGSSYVCSASVAAPPAGLGEGKSVALTAGHCVVDEANGQFATNWMFVPDYDTNPAALTSSGSFCAQTTHGCWTTAGGALVVHRKFSEAGGFTSAALPADMAIAVLGLGGKDGVTDLDAKLGSQAIAFGQDPALLSATLTYAFGYPASGKYRGNDLVYCAGTTGTDPNTGGATYSLPCNMTGGSSGGPWLEPFNRTTGQGTLISVNSYGYSGSSVMYGPPLGSDAKSVYDAAASASTNTKVG